MAAPTSADQLHTAHITQLLLLNLGSRNACMRALIAHPNDLNASANWLITHRNDANIDSDPFAQTAATTTATTTSTTIAASTTASTTINRSSLPQPSVAQTPTQQQMIQQVMNAGYSREEALRAYTNVSTADHNEVAKLTRYLREHPKRDTGASSAYSNSSWYPYANQNKKKVARPVIDIDKIEVDKEEMCDVEQCEELQHICIMMREYKKFLQKMEDENESVDTTQMKDGTDYEAHGFYAYFVEAISGDDDDEKYTLSDVMDDFLHVLNKHDTRYGELSKVQRIVLGKDGMDGALASEALRSRILQRIRCAHNSDDDEVLEKYYFGFSSVKEISLQQLCDKMYVYLVHSYDLAVKLDVAEYEALDEQLGVRTNAELHAEKLQQRRLQQQLQNDADHDDMSTLVKEKDIACYVGHTYFANYSKLLAAKRDQTWFATAGAGGTNAQYNKFYGVVNVDAFQTRIDPKELKTKLHKQRRAEREKKRLHEAAVQKEKQALVQKELASAAADDKKDDEKEDATTAAESKAAAAAGNETEAAKDASNTTSDATTEATSKPAVSDEAQASPQVPQPQPSPKPSPKASPQASPSKVVEHVDKKEFSFGVRYNYWPEFEDLIALNITQSQAKHGDLEAELTQNAVCKLSAFEYGVLKEKASIYLETTWCKESIEAGVNPFGIEIMAPIEKSHIMAVMVYCNYDALRNALCATYMRLSEQETDDAMIERHSHFYWLGKYLREAVECYGTEAHKSETKRFYHGMAHNTRIMQDDEIKALFVYPPLSTTSCMELALNHCSRPNNNSNNNNNDVAVAPLILEIKGFVCKYFDCAWLSDVCYEKEKVFFGGNRALTVNKCIDYTFGYDHKLFVTAMKYIPDIFRASSSEWKINKHDDMLQETKDAIRNLLFSQLNKFGDNASAAKYPDNFGENGVPRTQAQRLAQFCASTTEVRMHYDAMYNYRAYAFLSSLFMTATRTFVELSVIRELFPNVTTFSLIRVPLTTLTFMYLKSFISPPNQEEEKDDHKDGNGDDDADNNGQPLRCQIREFRLIDPKTDAMSIAQVIQAEEKSLAALQWTISSPDQVSLLLQYSDTPVAVKEPTPPPVAVVAVQDDSKTENEADKAKTEKSASVSTTTTKKVMVKRIVKRVVKKKKSQADVSDAQASQPGAAPTSQTEISKPADAQ